MSELAGPALPAPPGESGWRNRLQNKLAVAGVAGAGTGMVLSVLHSRPFLSFTATSTASFLLIMSMFGVVQEAVRGARGKDGAGNSLVGGAVTGATVQALHGRRLALGAAAFGAAAALAHVAWDACDPAAVVRRALIAADLLDGADGAAGTGTTAPSSSNGGDGGATPRVRRPDTWLEHFTGIRRLTDEEWAEHTAKRDEAWKQRLTNVLGEDADIRPRARAQQQGDRP